MGNIGEPMTNPTVPPVGTSGTGYASTINLFLTEVKQRLEDPVPLSSVTIDAFNLSNVPIDNAQYVGFANAASLPSDPAGSIHYYNGDFYMVTSLGAVKVTDGLTLNIAGVGGITGDYGGVNPAQLRFIDADKTYYFYDDFGAGEWARMFGRSVDVTGIATGFQRVRITWTGSSSYDLKLPVAAPAGQLLLQMGATGTMLTSNTLAADLTLAVDDDIILSGTGTLKHGEYGVSASAAFQVVQGTAGITHIGGSAPVVQAAAGAQISIHTPPVVVKPRCLAVKVTGDGSALSTAPTIVINRLNSAGGLTNVPFTQVINGAITGAFEYVFTITTPIELGEGHNLVVSWTPAGATTTFRTITLKFDRINA